MTCFSRFARLWSVFDLASKQQEIEELHAASVAPGFWDNAESAQGVMQKLARLEANVKEWVDLEGRAADLAEMQALVDENPDPEMLTELDSEVRDLADALDKMRLNVMMSGPHDDADAIISIHAGAGGTESQDWAQMLMRMYLRWAERHGFQADVIEETEGDEAGLKSATLEIKGTNVYGLLKSERGVHRLVRISPFDNAHRRHTSFVLLEVVPDVADEIDIQIGPDDVRMDVFHASGHGGQNVQKNSTAVRLTHIPTGIVVSCQNERSQLQNRERAMEVLKSRLYNLEVEKQEEERAKLRGEHVTAGWGNQIRSYVLHPYRMVKDLRTDWETGNTTAVLDGDLDGLIEAYLKYSVGRN